MLASQVSEPPMVPPGPTARDVTGDQSAEEELHFLRDPMRRLPVEVINLISEKFVLTAGLPLLLGWVCRDWRFVSWNSPSLWANIRFGLPPTNEWYLTLRYKEHLEMAFQWLERSRSLPLHIEIYCPINSHGGRNGWEPVSLERGLLTLLKKFAGRWRIFVLSFAKDDRIGIFFGTDEYFAAPMLEKLRIELVPEDEYGSLEEDEPHFFLPGCSPSLMDLGDVDLSLISINWRNLTRLSFYFCNNFGPDELIDLLESAPNLEICQVRGTSRLERTPDDPVIRNHFFTHSKLHTLALIVDEESSRQPFGRLFSLVNFPSLRTLKYAYREAPKNVQIPMLRKFIPFAFKTATSLANLYLRSITAVPHSTNFFVVLLQAMNNLQTLAICHCSGFISDFFFEQFEGGRFLPSLRIFKYVGSRSFSWTFFKKMLQRMDAPPQGVATVSVNLNKQLSGCQLTTIYNSCANAVYTFRTNSKWMNLSGRD